MGKRGPRSTITAEKVGEIIGNMKKGAGFARACSLADVPQETGRGWRKRGERHRRMGEVDTVEAMLSSAVDRVQSSFAGKAESIMLQAFETSGKGKLLCDRCRGDALSANQRIQTAKWYLSNVARADYGDDYQAKLRSEIEDLVFRLRPYMEREAYRQMLHAMKLAHREGDVDVDDGGDDDEEGEDDAPVSDGATQAS